MRKALLLFNPLSGMRRHRRLQDVEAAASTLRSGGVEVEMAATRSAAEAREQAQEAILAGCDTVFAGGGDGTVHDVLQGMVNSPAALAVLPLGTANTLAHDLKLPRQAAAAAQAALTGNVRSVTLGHAEFTGYHGERSSRYFIITAGIGVDAHLFYKLNAGLKQRTGMFAYYAHGAHLWLTHPLGKFMSEFLETGVAQLRRAVVSQLLAVRIRNFGGLLQEVAPGASLERNDLRLVLFRTQSRAAYLLYVLRGLLRQSFAVRGIELVSATQVSCFHMPPAVPRNGNPHSTTRIHLQLDGELVGVLPVRITVVEDAVNLVVPSAPVPPVA